MRKEGLVLTTHGVLNYWFWVWKTVFVRVAEGEREEMSPFFSFPLVITNQREEVFRCVNSVERFGSFELISLRAARVGRCEKEKHLATLLL